MVPTSEHTPALRIERMTVRADRIVCEAELSPQAPRTTTPALAARIRAAFPGIEGHACINGEGDIFGAVIDHTSLPHVLEHLVVHLQASAAAAERPGTDDAVFVGTTEFTDAARRRARIEVSFADDLVALSAFRQAAAFLNDAVWALEGESSEAL